MDRTTIPWNTSIRDFQRGHATHVAKILEQTLILPKDMDALRKMRQQDLFMSLKRDIALISILFVIFLLNITIFFLFPLFFIISLRFTWDCYVILMQITQEVFCGQGMG